MLLLNKVHSLIYCNVKVSFWWLFGVSFVIAVFFNILEGCLCAMQFYVFYLYMYDVKMRKLLACRNYSLYTDLHAGCCCILSQASTGNAHLLHFRFRYRFATLNVIRRTWFSVIKFLEKKRFSAEFWGRNFLHRFKNKLCLMELYDCKHSSKNGG